jgi:RHS repeat-associated protein
MASLVTTTTVDDRGRERQRATTSAGTVVAAFTYQRTTGGVISSERPEVLAAQQPQTYTHDALARLSGVNAAAITYDPASNVTGLPGTGAFTYDDANQLLSIAPATIPGRTFDYSDDGERTQTVSGGTTDIYTWDPAQRLEAFTRGSSGVAYEYDGDGLLATRTAGGTSTQFLWDTTTAIPELVAVGSRHVLHGPAGEAFEQIQGTTRTYLLTDQLGSVRAETNTSGAVTATYQYTPYGELSGQSGAGTAAIGWAGEYADPTSRHVYLRARWYDPATAQFTSRDPITAITHEPYQYAGSSPVMASDPTGLWCGFGHNPDGQCRGHRLSGPLDIAADSLGLASGVAYTVAAGCMVLRNPCAGPATQVAIVADGLSVVSGVGALMTKDHQGIPVKDIAILGMSVVSPSGRLARLGGEQAPEVNAATEANDHLFSSPFEWDGPCP